MGSWYVKIECVKDGRDVDFDALSDEDREHILECVKDGYRSGELSDSGETEE